MIKYVVLLRRRSDITSEEFERHWLGNHRELVGQLPGLRAHLFSPTVDVGDYAAAWNGIGELWFDDAESAMAAFKSEIGQRVRADTETFADSGSASRFFAHDASAAGLAAVEASTAAPGSAG